MAAPVLYAAIFSMGATLVALTVQSPPAQDVAMGCSSTGQNAATVALHVQLVLLRMFA